MSTEVKDPVVVTRESTTPVSTVASATPPAESAKQAIPDLLRVGNTTSGSGAVCIASSNISQRDRTIGDDRSQEGNSMNRKQRTSSSSHISGPESENDMGNLSSVNRENPNSDPRNLIVNYIPTPVTEEVLRELFEPFGEVESVRIIVDKVTNHPKGYGFVKFVSEKSAREATKEMNGYEIANKRLRVTQANGPAQHPPGGAAAPAPGATATAGATSHPSSVQGSHAGIVLPQYSGGSQVFPVQPTQVLMAVPPSLPPGFAAYPMAATPSSGFAFLPAAAAPQPQPQPQPQPPQQVFFAATPIAGGYQIHPQPLSFLTAGNAVFPQPIVAHSPNPVLYLPTAAATAPTPQPLSVSDADGQQLRPLSQTHALPGVMTDGALSNDAQGSSIFSASSSGGPVSAMRSLSYQTYNLAPSPPQQTASSMHYTVAGSSYSAFNSAASADRFGQGYVVGSATFPGAFSPTH